MLKTKKLETRSKKIQTRKIVEGDLHTDHGSITDLCSTCNHRGSCTLSSLSSTIYYCEEFDDSKVPHDSVIEPERSFEENTVVDSRHLGLCVNCIHRETCSLSKMEGGVWHCEEYE
jgi:hypothetical protein